MWLRSAWLLVLQGVSAGLQAAAHIFVFLTAALAVRDLQPVCLGGSGLLRQAVGWWVVLPCG